MAATQQVAEDAVIGATGGGVFLTTGPAACEAFDEVPGQLAMTPMLAFRLAEILKVALQYPAHEPRRQLIEEWAANERLAVPHAVLEVGPEAVRVGIEPLGTGCTVPVLWRHVPALTLHLDAAARQRLGGL